MITHDGHHYGVVIDAGSSGSRIHVFKWQDNDALLAESTNEELVHSVPQIFQDKDWTQKVTPGLSKYGSKPHKAFSKHVKPLLDFAREIIPEDKIKETPVFLQATAGMRLLEPAKRDKILKEICKGIKHSTDFLLSSCESQIQVIDGQTEGLYGWLSLNYLLGHFNNYDPSKTDHFTFGFMDMGGASTQIAFSPSDQNEIERHRDDIARITLKSVNGDLQEWDVFVSTWLGFGANEARRRYLVQMINGLPENTNYQDDDDYSTRTLTDPCLPKNCVSKFEYKDKDFKFIGSGNFEQCSKSIYPLLLKNLPCSEEPCLFNGVHAPQIDYFKDKFVGTSEYWYTANDVFDLGGTYNFEEFSNHVKDFCSTDWEVIKANSDKGFYNSIPQELLVDSCFKANWVLNVLHEGFDLPRIDIDKTDKQDSEDEHPLFQSAINVNERELSWTLGRILLYASAGVGTSASPFVGITPSSHKFPSLDQSFIPGGLVDAQNGQGIRPDLQKLVLFVIVVILCLLFLRKTSTTRITSIFSNLRLKTLKSRYLEVNDPQSQLEQGFYRNDSEQLDGNDTSSCKFRSKSMFNLNTGDEVTESGPSYPMRFVAASTSSSPTLSRIPSTLPLQQPKTLRPAFSLADFSKFKDGKFND
ncbi:hypothetical protein HG537_0F03710 [Torulaspora globosa]|uniref:Golgi apyrase n=1 Tax=Torulaspora globosa TaxID=48254 RepID=A0A7H9HW55_9SACH|nr:hypothetical protein HG537_0F03710 [Torulaspora sp. CBS 2947]